MSNPTVAINGANWTEIQYGGAFVQFGASPTLFVFSQTRPLPGSPANALPGNSGVHTQDDKNLWLMTMDGTASTVTVVPDVAAPGGGSGGGGATTIADGANVTQGSVADAAGALTIMGQIKSAANSLTAILARQPAAPALDASLQSILTVLQAQRADTLWTDDTNAFFVRVDNQGAVTWLTPTGAASSAPGTGIRPAAGTSAIVDSSRYQATIAGTGYTVGDYLSHVVTTDPATGAILGFFWLNVSQNAKLAAAPLTANITPISSLPANAAQETGGNLAVIAANISTAANQAAASTILSNILTKLGSAVLAAGNAIIGKVGIDQTTPGTTNAVYDTQSAPFQGAVSMTAGTTYAAQRSVGVLCTVAGNVAMTMADASIITLPVAVGWNTFPFAATAINSSGTTATATYYNLK
jgi:hypothetical protein